MLSSSRYSESCYHLKRVFFLKTLILLLSVYPLFFQTASAQEEPEDLTKATSPSIISREQTQGLSSLIERSLNTLSRKQEINNQPLQLTPEQQEWLNNHKTIRLGVDANWAPYEFVDEVGKLQGVSSDVLHLIEQKLGVHFKIR
jgi:ABC-type amino acid transport substrate-binding protein